jgi:Flp pilus assembly pilin Flp
MNNIQVKDKKNHKKELGASLVEYGLLIALISVIVLA